MVSNRSETRSIWWKGALKSGVKETLRGLAVGLLAAGILFGVASFIGMTAGVGATLGTMVAPLGSFNPALLMAFCGVISGVTGLFTGGSQAVAAYEQRKINVGTVQALHEIDGRTRALEHVVTPARHVQKILENGSCNAASFQTAEAERAQARKGPTIH
jgi:hypothetical protein